MTLYTMVSEKQLNNIFYSNTYTLNAATLAAAVTAAGIIRTIEREVHCDIVSFTKYRVSDKIVGTDIYQVVEDNVTGDIPFGANEMLPMFNRVRVDFNTEGGGRPSRKYLCTPVLEGWSTNGVLSLAVTAQFRDNYVTPLLALPAFVDVDNQAFFSGSVNPHVAMRQLRRGSKRKLLPIIP